ncbi:MAG: hypothetical protein MMC33_004624 [Icmadophila ericetorum]|nr:hypothetical protein [Icmadophila ericetorum]
MSPRGGVKVSRNAGDNQTLSIVDGEPLGNMRNMAMHAGLRDMTAPRGYISESLPIEAGLDSLENVVQSLTSEESLALAQNLGSNHQSVQSPVYESPKPPTSGQRRHGIVRSKIMKGGAKKSRLKANQESTTPTTNVLNKASISMSDGTTFLKSLGASSLSSADSSGTMETDDHRIMSSAQDSSSPASSISSQLSPIKSNTPVITRPIPQATPQQQPQETLQSTPTSQETPQVMPRLTLQGSAKLEKAKRRRSLNKTMKIRFSDLRPRVSIPAEYSQLELARQSIQAAYSSRLNPFSMHPEEYEILRDHMCQLHVTTYLSIRNRILRLWVRNPLVSVTAEEAAGCAQGPRWLNLAEVAYEWLVRRGYINFGCVDIPEMINPRTKRYSSRKKTKTIVVIGAGMAGLGCARQLEGLFRQYRDRLGEEPPNVVVLEGRARIGGRIYSLPLHNQNSSGIPEQARCTAEMGAHIITGFDHGNPLSMIIRGQLALHYYPLKDNSTLYDIDGKIVDRDRDKRVEKLFNDILDRASVYRHKIPTLATANGDRDLMETGRDPIGDAGEVISASEQEQDSAIQDVDMGVGTIPAGVDKLTGKAHLVSGSKEKVLPGVAAESMGWKLKSQDLASQDIDLETAVKDMQYPTLGATMDEAVKYYQYLLDLSPQDMRLLNWHYANLEYANAANVGKLSLGGWDQDIGNEFEGEHAQVIGGYQQVPRGIWSYPSKLDVRTQKVAKHILYDAEDSSSGKARVVCEDGEIIDASHIVLTTPLGVLKEHSITFQPELPSWKIGAIDRLGFGVLNKVILIFDEPFWHIDQDMIGLLRSPANPESLEQDDYVRNRGRFYLFWNCIKTTGRPQLIALIAGDAAHEAETMEDGQIVAEVTSELAKMYSMESIPEPTETIVTRWGRDRFARGTYSYVGPASIPGDYDAMAKSIGNLYFAGEATCGTHPATVHGAYISGLRAASDIVEDMLGPIDIPMPFVPAAGGGVGGKSELVSTPPIVAQASPRSQPQSQTQTLPQPQPQPQPPLPLPLPPPKSAPQKPRETAAQHQARLESFETDILKEIYTRLGPRPTKPGKIGANPFLLFSTDKWAEVKEQCDATRRNSANNPNTKASRNEVRIALGKLWREASDEFKAPYVATTAVNKANNHEYEKTFSARLQAWDNEAMSVRKEYVDAHPGVLSAEEEREMWLALGAFGDGVGVRKAKLMSGYALGMEPDVAIKEEVVDDGMEG